MAGDGWREMTGTAGESLWGVQPNGWGRETMTSLGSQALGSWGPGPHQRGWTLTAGMATPFPHCWPLRCVLERGSEPTSGYTHPPTCTLCPQCGQVWSSFLA